MASYVRKGALVLFLLAFASCRDLTGPKSLDEARALWAAQHLTTYSYFGSQTCYCANSATVVVEVSNGRVSAVTNLIKGTPESVAGWLTVDELFDFAARSQPQILEFDKVRGFPRRVERCCLVDDSGFVYSVSGFSLPSRGS